MNCEEAQILSAARIMGDLNADEPLCRRLEAHLASCPRCAREYRTYEQTIEYLGAHRPELERAFAALDAQHAAGQGGSGRPTRQALWRHWGVGVSAAAACVALAVLGWLVYRVCRTPLEFRPATPAALVHDGGASDISPGWVHIALCGPQGEISLVPGQRITSGDTLKELVVNSKHRLVLNERTSLSIRPLMSHARLGCLVELHEGEVFAEVEHDGNPFVVESAHGRATITGTVFDIQVSAADMTLVVATGSVRLGARHDSVDVMAGQVSRIEAGAAPSEPVSCDPVVQTAWARRSMRLSPAGAFGASPDGLTEELPVPGWSAGESFDLRKLDYGTWVREQQEWFTRQFPQILQLREALAGSGVEVDYPDLLVRSGVLWAFAYRPASRERLLPVGDHAILRAARGYGLDRTWLAERRLIGRASPGIGQFSGIEAFASWRREFADVLEAGDRVDEQALLASAHASVYVLNTRTLIWLLVETGRYAPAGVAKAELQDCLEREIEAAYTCARHVITLLTAEDAELPCRSYEYRRLVEGVYQAIGEMAAVEKEFTDAMETVQN